MTQRAWESAYRDAEVEMAALRIMRERREEEERLRQGNDLMNERFRPQWQRGRVTVTPPPEPANEAGNQFLQALYHDAVDHKTIVGGTSDVVDPGGGR